MENRMIIYKRLWDTMKQRGISQYQLINEYNISTGQLDRLRKNESTNTLDHLCSILHCNREDVAEHINNP